MADLQSAISSLEEEKNFSVKDFQRLALLSFASGHDVFVCQLGWEKLHVTPLFEDYGFKMNFSMYTPLYIYSSFRPSSS